MILASAASAADRRSGGAGYDQKKTDADLVRGDFATLARHGFGGWCLGDAAYFAGGLIEAGRRRGRMQLIRFQLPDARSRQTASERPAIALKVRHENWLGLCDPDSTARFAEDRPEWA